MGLPSGRDGGQVAVVLNFCQGFSGPIGAGGREGWGKGRSWEGWGRTAHVLGAAGPPCYSLL